MLDFLFAYGGYTPHGFCLAWDLRVLWTHIGADILIAVSYFSIPAVIVAFLRQKRDPALTKPALLFTAFILLCGVTHLMAILTLYVPLYGLQGALKLLTGLISAVTAVVLWKMYPLALDIPSRGELLTALAHKDDEIAERVRAEKAAHASELRLARKVEELESVNSELSEFAYAASHDLKAPSNTLSMWIEDFEIEYGAAMPEAAQQELSEVKDLTGRMRTIVDDILAYSRLVNNADSTTEVDLREVFETAIKDAAHDIAATGAKVDVGNLPVIRGNAHYLAVLARNLLSNALKFHDGSRQPRIRISGDRRPHADGRLGFTVADNGIGIAEEHQDRIFSLFKRLHGQDEYPGTGLGLALCRRAVALHGGTIEVASSPGVGTTFHVTLESEVRDAEVAA